MANLDLTKPYRTRSGREAWAVESPQRFTTQYGPAFLLGWVLSKDGRRPFAWAKNGKCVVGDRFVKRYADYDLVNTGEGLPPVSREG